VHATALTERSETPKELRGLWVATVARLDYPSKAGLSASTLQKEADAILDNAVSMGFNVVLLQVRPAADALYPSSIYPWSAWLTGSQDTAPDNSLDPLAYWVTQAHKRSLQLYAWINPYRVARNASEAQLLSAKHPAKLAPDTVLKTESGALFFDPGHPDVSKMIVAGVNEIVSNYSVDGIMLDDYFYPDSPFDDSRSFGLYGSGFSDKNNWRREKGNLSFKFKP
jgi:uncharacterized lipoprotein YddW (UPF0748 family)